MLQRLHWLLVLTGLLLLAACVAAEIEEPVAATDSAETGSVLVAGAATQPPPPTATPEGPLVTTAEPQSVELGSGDSAETPQSESKPVATPAQPDVLAEQDQPFQLGYQQTAYLAADELHVTFIAVPEDSRCPADVDCVWSGAVTVELQLLMPDQPVVTGTLRLVGGIQEGPGELLPGYVFTLQAVDPYPVSTELPTPLTDYVLTLEIGTRPIRPQE